MACGSMADLPTDADVLKTLKNSTKVEDLERVKTSNYMLWQFLTSDDGTLVSVDHVVHIDVKGNWFLNQNTRQITFELQNATEITKRFAIFIENYAQDFEPTNDKRLILIWQHFEQIYLRYKEHYTRVFTLNLVKTSKILYFF